jgi:hypothetical protein
MNLLWQDNFNLLWRDDFGSLLNSLTPDASGNSVSFTGSDGQASLWSGSLTGQDMLWAEPASSPATWQLADNAGTAGVAGLGDGSLSYTGASLLSDFGSLLWQTTLFVFEEISTAANSSTLDSTLNQILGVVWTDTGGTGSPPVTLPHAPSNPFANGFPPISLPSSALAWTGQPPLTPPLAGNSLLTGVLPGSLSPQQLVWTDLSTAVSPLLDGAGLTGVLPPTLFSRS